VSQSLLFVGTSAPDMKSRAELSECHMYRWWLSRTWSAGESEKLISWVMLNPSTADHRDDDATLRRIIRFSKDWGYDALLVVNLYPLRSTDPKVMLVHPGRTGGARGNDELKKARGGDLILCAWGANAESARVREAVGILRATEKPLYCLGLTQSGQPVHPLRQRADLKPQLYKHP
jgi:hypothetical protein